VIGARENVTLSRMPSLANLSGLSTSQKETGELKHFYEMPVTVCHEHKRSQQGCWSAQLFD
jgi:hypothetical protein